MTLSKEFTSDFVTSKDGTKIGYRQIGAGPGLLLVHGGMMSSLNFLKLAELLADEFTVYIPDRRGRGLSGSHGNYSLSAEGEDIKAIISKTKAQYAFGLSSGAIVVLQTAMTEPTLKRIALYEPPIPANGTNPASWADKYESAISQGNFGKAFMSIVKGTGDSSLLNILPDFLITPFLNLAIKADAKKVKEDKVPLKVLISAIHFDIQAVHESESLIDKCKNLGADVLLLGGDKSQHYLKVALEALSAVLPNSKRIEFPRLGHLAAENGGKPNVVAAELRSFFGGKREERR